MLDRLDYPPGELMSFHHLAGNLGVPFHEIENINTGHGSRVAREFQPDLILSVKFGQIFKEPILSLPSFGILNTHSGALPQYAGLWAPVRTLLAGERRFTSTLHVVDQGIDTGPVIASGHLPVEPNRSLFWHLPRLYVLGIELFLQVLPGLTKCTRITAHRQENSRRRYYGKLTTEEEAAFEKQGFRFLDDRDYAEITRRFGVDLFTVSSE
ncbi:formyltransferase family protein [Streptomyces olivoreticuli]|uniref:formyltransferase family protein n=1 Tax=Streptomyces olivoreticuli TaxID=68246 RepID=UPI0013C34F7C|nr:formyltransferase family protein [Streptomyces olivoreticuli]